MNLFFFLVLPRRPPDQVRELRLSFRVLWAMKISPSIVEQRGLRSILIVVFEELQMAATGGWRSAAVE